MRKALNENPMVQIVVIGVVAVALVLMLFMTVLKKEEVPVDPAAAAGATADAAALDPATDPAATGSATVDPAATDPAAVDPAATAAATPVDPAVAPPVAPAASDAADSGLLPTKGLPKDVIIAYAKNGTIALLVIDPKAIADRKIETYTKKISSSGKDIEVFTVDVKDIADYSRITAGVSVNQAPALVVIRPRKLNDKDSPPVASVAYGFRSPRSVKQAFEDALYDGGSVSSYP